MLSFRFPPRYNGRPLMELTKGVFRFLNICVVGVWQMDWGQDHRDAVMMQEL